MVIGRNRMIVGMRVSPSIKVMHVPVIIKNHHPAGRPKAISKRPFFTRLLTIPTR